MLLFTSFPSDYIPSAVLFLYYFFKFTHRYELSVQQNKRIPGGKGLGLLRFVKINVDFTNSEVLNPKGAFAQKLRQALLEQAVLIFPGQAHVKKSILRFGCGHGECIYHLTKNLYDYLLKFPIHPSWWFSFRLRK